MLPGGEGGSYKSEAQLLPPHHCSSFLARWELGPPRRLGRKEELPLPTQPQARGKEEAGERPKVPPPPTWGSLQAEVSGAAGPHPRSPTPGGLSLSPPSFDLQTRDSLFCHCHASIKALFKENKPNMTHLCTHTQKKSLYFCQDILTYAQKFDWKVTIYGILYISSSISFISSLVLMPFMSPENIFTLLLLLQENLMQHLLYASHCCKGLY